MNMCDRLIHMIGGLATPVDVKLQLIQVFQHMHHDAETAATVSKHFLVTKLIFLPPPLSLSFSNISLIIVAPNSPATMISWLLWCVWT